MLEGFRLRQNKSDVTYLKYCTVFNTKVCVLKCWACRSQTNTLELRRDKAKIIFQSMKGKSRPGIVRPRKDSADEGELRGMNGAPKLVWTTGRKLEEAGILENGNEQSGEVMQIRKFLKEGGDNLKRNEGITSDSIMKRSYVYSLKKGTLFMKNTNLMVMQKDLLK